MALNKDANGVSVPSYGPATQLVAITKNDSTDLTTLKIKGIWVGGTGDVAVVGLNDATPVTITAVPAGTMLPIMPKRVMSTGTTATLLIGLI
jgi:hypothetical protein